MQTGKILSIISLALLLLFGPVVARPALAGEVLIGVVMTANASYYNDMHQAFTEALPGVYADRVTILLQRPFPDPIALSNAARKLIAADVDLIITYGSPATLAVLYEKSEIPVVYAGVYDPAGIDLSGAKITGCGYKVPLSSLLRYLKSFKQIDRLSVIYSELEEDSRRQANEMADLAKQQNISLHKINIRSRLDIEKMAQQADQDAVFITGSAIVNQWLADIAAVLRVNHQPSAATFPDRDEAGIIVTLSQSSQDQGEEAAKMVARILQGEQPGKIAPQIFRKTDLVFNLREARKMDLKVPINLIAEATKVIR